MNLFVTSERRFFKAADGSIRTDNAHTTGYSFWKRYLKVFDSVTVVGRLSDIVCNGGSLVEGKSITFLPIADFFGAVGFLRNHRVIKRQIIRAMLCTKDSAYIVRSPTTFGSLVISCLKLKDYPYGIELVGDPFDVFAPGVISHPMRPLMRWWSCRILKKQVKQASAVSYVTKFALQKRYPSSEGVYVTNYSSIELTDDSFCRPRRFKPITNRLNLIYVGSLSQLYKAPDVLINAASKCKEQGLDFFLSMIGGGVYLEKLKLQVARLGLNDNVRFLGQLSSGESVRTELDKADIFILPSKTEGLPRAMIEAMARGLPCIGTSVGGIPELLNESEMVPPGDDDALSILIQQLADDTGRLTRLSRDNMEKAHNFHSDVLNHRRNEFYQYLKESTERFLK